MDHLKITSFHILLEQYSCLYILFNRNYFLRCAINEGSVRSLLNILHTKSERLGFSSHNVGSDSMDRYDVKKSTETETKSHSRITVKWDDVLCQWKTPLPYICERNKKL